VVVVVATGSLAFEVTLSFEVGEPPEAFLLGMLGALSTFVTLAAALLPTAVCVAIVFLVLPVTPALGLAGAPREAILLVLPATHVRLEEAPADRATELGAHAAGPSRADMLKSDEGLRRTGQSLTCAV